MCGIAGVVLPNAQDLIPPDWLGNIAKILKHRGPDDVGFLGYSLNSNTLLNNKHNKPIVTRDFKSISNISLGFVHTRLSIIDAEHGWQPMCDVTGRYSIIFNGEIYNYLEIRKTLEQHGYSFSTKSDTEVLLTAFIHWGANCLQKIEGMFAFAILDVKKNYIFIARDPFGIKPLYYVCKPDMFAFASEIKALLCLPAIARNINLKTARRYLLNGITDANAETFFQEILQLPPAHFMEINLFSPYPAHPIQYWSPVRTKNNLTLSEASKSVNEIFLHSVKQQLRSDVPVGATLSGGIDSSSIVMAMQKMGQNMPISTYSYLAEEHSNNEEKWIDLLHLNTGKSLQCHKININPKQVFEDIDDLIYSQDEPFGSTSIIAQRQVFKRVQETGIKVTLDGQGADEIFAGYPLYLSARLMSLLKRNQYLKAALFLKKSAIQNTTPYLYILLRLIRMLKSDPVFDSLKETMTSTILPALLRYIDRNSMRFSVESRVPFLSRSLVDFVYSLPEEYLISPHGKTKVVLRQSMQDLLPDQILNRRDKISFQTPEAAWLKALGGWAEDMLHRPKLKEIYFINQKSLTKALQANAIQSNAVKDERPLQARRFWRYLNFIRWAEIYEVAF